MLSSTVDPAPSSTTTPPLVNETAHDGGGDGSSDVTTVVATVTGIAFFTITIINLVIISCVVYRRWQCRHQHLLYQTHHSISMDSLLIGPSTNEPRGSEPRGSDPPAQTTSRFVRGTPLTNITETPVNETSINAEKEQIVNLNLTSFQPTKQTETSTWTTSELVSGMSLSTNIRREPHSSVIIEREQIVELNVTSEFRPTEQTQTPMSEFVSGMSLSTNIRREPPLSVVTSPPVPREEVHPSYLEIPIFHDRLESPPFVGQIDVLKCDSSGKEFTNDDHDITLRVPEGAIPDGVTVHIEAGIALHGPFQFPPGMRPISPIVWFCMQERIPFLKPVEVILPHFLHDWKDLQLSFLKANHSTHTTNDGEKRYMFQPVNDPMEFHFEDGRGFGILSTKHFCSLCIAANITRDRLPSKAQYCLTEIIPHPWPSMPSELMYVPLHFCVTFFMKTCFETLKKQFPSGVKISRSQFTFQTTELDHSEPRLQIDIDRPQSGWDVALKQKEIRASAVDYWERPELELMEEEVMYPPRFTVEACGTMATGNSVVKLRFKGSREDLCTEVILPLYPQASAFPVSPTTPHSANSVSSISSSVRGGCASSGPWNCNDYHLEDEKPKLPALLKFPTERGHINIPRQIGRNHDFGVFLLNDETGAIVDGIAHEHQRNIGGINAEILRKWLQGQGKTPVTWRTLIDVLRDSEFSQLADEIHKNLHRLT